MSRNEWEHGTITLPSAEVSRLKGALREAANQHHDQVRAEVVRMHKQARTRSVTRYQGFLRQFWTGETPVSRDALNVLYMMVHRAREGRQSIHQPTVVEISREAPRYTNRDTAFSNLDCSVSFEGRTVTWDVPGNNHAVDHARDSVLGRTFFDHLRKINWTRGTGGHIIGNDEYNQDSRDCGGGANYVTDTFGPRN